MTHPRLDLDSIYDCIIIGGGPAGMTAAIFLGRYLRKTLVIDSGRARNWAARGIHGFLGYHEIAPAELVARGRKEAESVGVKFLDARATKIVRSGEHFEVTTPEAKIRCRRILLAYGIRDELPKLDRFEEFYGRSIFHCPDCDGYESRGKKIGVIGRGKKVAGLSLELRLWSDDITIFTDGEGREMDSAQLSKLQAQGIKILEDSIEELVGEEGNLREVRLRSGDCVPCESIFFTLGNERSCALAEEAGCRIVDGKIDIETDRQGQTSVEGIYAAGDLVTGSQLVITAAADGAIAAIAINKSLLPPALRV